MKKYITFTFHYRVYGVKTPNSALLHLGRKKSYNIWPVSVMIMSLIFNPSAIRNDLICTTKSIDSCSEGGLILINYYPFNQANTALQMNVNKASYILARPNPVKIRNFLHYKGY